MSKINTKNMTPEERKIKIKDLLQEHKEYFDINNITTPPYIPKMAYRPTNKDELHISFFPSELENNTDIYTEFVSIDYDPEDLKRTLYLLKYNPHWKHDYELTTSNSGFQRHIVPASDLKVINDINNRNQKNSKELEIELTDPDERDIVDVLKGIERALLSINQKLK